MGKSIVAAMMMLLVSAALFAAVPRTMNYQGKLTDSGGVALSGSHTIVFKIYDAETGGSVLWTETRTVPITNGLFDVQLGSTTPIDLDFSEPYWIELTVDGETLTPREAFAPVGYSYRSIHSDTADYALGGGGDSTVIQSVSSEANREGRYGHIMFVPHEGSVVTESSPAHDDTIYIAIGQEGAGTCTDPPATPDSIYGSNDVCSMAEGIAYAVAPVAGATFYVWTVPSGADITGGLGTNSIAVNFGTSGGNISVVAQNACGSSSSSPPLSVTITPPPFTPGAISGPASACSGDAGVAYSISAVTGATSYTWTLPAGAFITSGYGTNSIVVTFGSGSGNICVTADNACGSSAQQCKAVTVYESLTGVMPGAITGANTVCSGEMGVTYSISPVTGAAFYSWTVPTGATIVSGSATNSITVDFGTTSGNVCVTAHNSCGASDPRCLPVTVSPTTVAGSVTGGTTPLCYGNPTGTMTLGGYVGSILKWQKQLDGGEWTDISSTASTYSETPTSVGTWNYRAQVRSGACDAVFSAPDVITVNPVTVAGSVSGGTTPICDGSSTGTMTLAGYTGDIIKWQKRVDGGAWADITCTAPTFSETPTSPGTWDYRAQVQSGGCSADYSTENTIVVNSLSVAATSASASPSTICNGSSTTLSLSGGSLGTGASWKWYSGSCGGTSVGTGASISVSPTSTTTYYVRAEGTCNTTACVSVTVTVQEPPVVTVDPTDQEVNEGETATFTVTATGDGLTYQWQENAGSGWSNIGGATAASYTTPATTSGMNGYQYHCIVDNSWCDPDISATATLTVISTWTQTSQADFDAGVKTNVDTSVSPGDVKLEFELLSGWVSVGCSADGSWVWSSNRSYTSYSASNPYLYTQGGGCSCSCDYGWRRTTSETISGCNSHWYHIGCAGGYTGNCGGHDGETVYKLTLDPSVCHGYSSPGTLASQVLNTGVSGAVWDELSWSETLEASTDITFEVRASNSSFSASAASPAWTSVGGTSPVTSGLPSGQYMQWRATLSTSDTGNTPTLHEVIVVHH